MYAWLWIVAALIAWVTGLAGWLEEHWLLTLAFMIAAETSGFHVRLKKLEKLAARGEETLLALKKDSQDFHEYMLPPKSDSA